MAREGGPGGPWWSQWVWSGEAGEGGKQVLPGDMPTARLRPRLPGAVLVTGLWHTGEAVPGDRDSEEPVSWN